MNKRVTAVLLAIWLGGLSCPAALADDLPEPPADSGYLEEERPTQPTPEPGAAEEALQEPEPADDGCGTIEALAERVARDGGGEVAVTGDLSLPEGGTVRLEAGAPVTIDLGPHGITVPEGATLALSGPITLTGDGAPHPLLTVSGFLTAENGAVLSASGESAVAVRLTGGGWNTNRASVEAAGTDACAVEADVPLDLYRLRLTARGENAVCVRSAAPVRLTLSRAESEGDLAEAPALTLDRTAVSPERTDAHVIRRVAVPHDHYETNGLWLEAGDGPEMSLPAVERELQRLQDRQMELFSLAVAAGPDCVDYDEEINKVNLAKTRLLGKKAELERDRRTAEEFDRKMEEISRTLEQENPGVTAFDEITVRQLVSSIKVISAELLLIRFKDGTELYQTIGERKAAV